MPHKRIERQHSFFYIPMIKKNIISCLTKINNKDTTLLCREIPVPIKL